MAVQDETNGRRRDYIQSIDRAFAVLRCFTENSPDLTLSEVADRTDLDRSAARRYLLTLERLGYIGRERSRFHLRPKIMELGYSYLASLSLPRLAQPHLMKLLERCRESCAITVLDGPDITYVAVANVTKDLSIQLSVGNRIPACCTAMGRVLLSGLADAEVWTLLTSHDHIQHRPSSTSSVEDIAEEIVIARAQGWALVDQELEEGVRSIAVPIHANDGSIVAAVSVNTPASRVSVEALSGDIRAAAQDTVARIEEILKSTVR